MITLGIQLSLEYSFTVVQSIEIFKKEQSKIAEYFHYTTMGLTRVIVSEEFKSFQTMPLDKSRSLVISTMLLVVESPIQESDTTLSKDYADVAKSSSVAKNAKACLSWLSVPNT